MTEAGHTDIILRRQGELLTVPAIIVDAGDKSPAGHRPRVAEDDQTL